jgi:hypothetical protein
MMHLTMPSEGQPAKPALEPMPEKFRDIFHYRQWLHDNRGLAGYVTPYKEKA